MIIIPDKSVVLWTPHTASRAMKEALITSGVGIRPDGVTHHPTPKEIHRLREKYSVEHLPIFTMTRNVVDHALAFWWGVMNTYAFEDWLRIPLNSTGFEAQRLNCYHAVANEFIPYEMGLQMAVEMMGVTRELKFNVIGSHAAEKSRTKITPWMRSQLIQRFSEDVKLYYKAAYLYRDLLDNQRL